VVVFSWVYESRFANFYQGLPKKKESEGFAFPVTVSEPGLTGADDPSSLPPLSDFCETRRFDAASWGSNR